MRSNKTLKRFPLAASLLGLLIYSLAIWIGGTKTPFELLEQTGLGITVAGFLAHVVDSKITQSMEDTVNDAARLMAQSTAQVRGAMALEIEGIYVRRGPSHERQHCTTAIEIALQSAIDGNERIDILCAAGPEFFKRDGDHFKTVCNGILADGNRSHLRVLILDPRSDAASERAGLELGHGTKHDIEASLDMLVWMRNLAPDRVCLRLHAFPRGHFLLATRTSLFHEGYPTAPLTPQDGPIGGRVALLQYRGESVAYTAWARHFEYVWSQAKDFLR